MTTESDRQLSRLIALLLAVVLVAVSCGDDDGEVTAPVDTDTDTDGNATADTDEDDGSEPADDGAASPDSSGSGTGSATLTIGGRESFNFEQELVCIALGGAVSGTFSDVEGVEVSIDVPPEDWETDTTSDWDPPSLTLRDERDEMNWRIFEAGPDIATTYPGVEGAVITNFSVDGSHATGNGMVIDTFAITRANAEGTESPQPVPVTFGFECS